MAADKRGRPAQLPGLGTDSNGLPVIDPTQNVLNLVDAETRRQDDIRNLVSKHLTEMAALRADYDGQLRVAESARIDAIRAVDVGAVKAAAEVSATQATMLATQVQTVAEALRTSVQAAATAASIAQANAIEPLVAAIADLRKTQYEAQGVRAQVVENRDDRRETGIGTRGWVAIGVALLAAGIGFTGLLITVGGIVIAVILNQP